MASEYNFTDGMRLYITGTTSSGTADLSRILVNGPTLVIRGDGVSPTKFKWAWDPPLILPGRGLYAFFIMLDPCFAYWDVLTIDHPLDYPEGHMLYTPRYDCTLQPWMQLDISEYPESDVVFQAGFCRDAATPVRRTSWGDLKLLYR